METLRLWSHYGLVRVVVKWGRGDIRVMAVVTLGPWCHYGRGGGHGDINVVVTLGLRAVLTLPWRH